MVFLVIALMRAKKKYMTETSLHAVSLPRTPFLPNRAAASTRPV